MKPDDLKNKVLLKLCTALVFISLSAAAETSAEKIKGPEPACPDCNVILIVLDTLRADHLGTYGHHRNTSVNIDIAAKESLVFENAVAQSPWTLTSHMSILTGLYPRRHGVMVRYDKLSEKIPTLAGILRENGYATFGFADGGYLSEQYGYHHFDTYSSRNFIIKEKGTFGTNSFNRMMRRFRQDKIYKKKFFLMWQTYQVHRPYNPPARYDLFSDRDYSGVVNVEPDLEDPVCRKHDLNLSKYYCGRKGKEYFKLLYDDMDAEDYEYVRRKYDGNIAMVDEQVGEIFRMLKGRGIDDKTIVVITSDHGESLADREHLKRFGHSIMYDEVLKIPLIVRIPGYGGNGRYKGLVESIDIMPTVLQSVGVEVPDGLDGVSLFSLVDGSKKKEIAYSVFYETFPFDPDVREYTQEQHAAYYKGYKMIKRSHGNKIELYNLKDDPKETKNLAGKRKSVEKVLSGAIEKRAAVNITPNREKRKSLGREERRLLRSLGYLH